MTNLQIPRWREFRVDPETNQQLIAGPTLEEYAATVRQALTHGPQNEEFTAQFQTDGPLDFVRNVGQAIHNRWTYVEDPVRLGVPVDLLSPSETLLDRESDRYLKGDCEDLALVFLSLFSDRNLDCRLVLVSAIDNGQDTGHAFAEIRMGDANHSNQHEKSPVNC